MMPIHRLRIIVKNGNSVEIAFGDGTVCLNMASWNYCSDKVVMSDKSGQTVNKQPASHDARLRPLPAAHSSLREAYVPSPSDSFFPCVLSHGNSLNPGAEYDFGR